MKSATDFWIESPFAHPKLWHIARRNALVVDRKLEQETRRGLSSPRIGYLLCGWPPRKDDLRLLRLSGRKPGQIA